MTTLSGPSMADGGTGRGASATRGAREPPSGGYGPPWPAATWVPSAPFGPPGPFPFMA
jgi:hypothetical protein